MKIMLLEPDKDLANSLDTYINGLRLKMNVKKLTSETELLQEKALNTYSPFCTQFTRPTESKYIKIYSKQWWHCPCITYFRKKP